jgi:UDP-GlcNAc:undecaprenyl-phosphate GlcNAc-1-phosphate transferase
VEILLAGIIALVVAAFAALVLMPLVIRVAAVGDVVDYPGPRRAHSEPTPRLGGVGIVGAILCGITAGLLFGGGFASGDISEEQVGLFVGSLLVMFLLGLADDLRQIAPTTKLVVQIVVAAIVVAAGWSFQGVQLPMLGRLDFGPILGVLLSVVWIVGITNAINLVDGLDGLAGGVSAIIAASLTVFAVLHGDPLAVVITASLTGACLGFLRFNWPPARIFMGDSGSLSLGFLLASVSLYASLKSSAAVAILVPFLALGLPAIDALLVMMVRFLDQPQSTLIARTSRMFRADRNHLHHILLDPAHQRQRVVWILYSVALIGCLMALAVTLSRSATLGYALLVVEVLAIALIRLAGVKTRVREQVGSLRRVVGQGVLEDPARSQGPGIGEVVSAAEAVEALGPGSDQEAPPVRAENPLPR